MSWSLGEFRALAVKAARGSGMQWGLAEEAGFSAERLEANGVCGADALASYLQSAAPLNSECCPVLLGTRISDKNSSENEFPAQIHEPLLLAPFLQNFAGEQILVLSWNETRVLITNKGISIEGLQVVGNGEPIDCKLSKTDTASSPTIRASRVPDERSKAMQILEELAKKTYAPATEESRAKGAGAGLNDND